MSRFSPVYKIHPLRPWQPDSPWRLIYQARRGRPGTVIGIYEDAEAADAARTECLKGRRHA